MMSGAMELENCSSEVKELYRSLYALVKSLEERKKKITTISQLFEPDINKKRKALIQQCQDLLFKDHQCIGKKSREILWRKGYYEFIALIKKNWHKKDTDKNADWLEKLKYLIIEGISNYKYIAAKLECVYDLDLKLLVDFSIINDEDFSKIEKLNECSIQKSLEVVGFALDTIHSAFLSLGDLHRYYLDFKFEDKSPKMKKELAARFYYQAFQLNSTIGMSQNQLGTLYYGQNYDLDSIYHYLYSLICTVPFELSETNVCKLFASHIDYLAGIDENKVEFSLQDFYARFYLIVDIFFFDKNVPEFNNLCHCVLIDLKKILCSKVINIEEASIFKIVCILMFCLSKLKMIDSPKVYSLTAFLVAVCSDLIDSCIVNLEQFILSKSKQNEKFQEVYTNTFNSFEAKVRKSREEYKTFYGKERPNIIILNNSNKVTKVIVSDIGNKSQKSDHEERITPPDVSSGSKDIRIESDVKTRSSGSQPKSNFSLNKNKKKNLRRRRKRILESDDESSSFDSDSELDTDFSSEEDEDEKNSASDLSSNFESDFSDMEEIPTETKCGENINNREKNPQQEESDYQQPTFSDSEDMIIEEETIIYPNSHGSSDLIEEFPNLNMINDLHFRSENEDENLSIPISRPESSADGVQIKREDREQPVKLKYKNKYSKIDPNIVIEFAQKEITMRTLKILFDWLRINNEILLGCYHTNPEFIHKIMKLLNYCNIDIFTRKVYFERHLIKIDDVRENLEDLFTVRSSISLSEDIALKGFDLLKITQEPLDWETPIRDKITENEQHIMRIFKMVDFAFFICKLNKFNYNFCSKTRRFTENNKKKRDKNRSGRKRERRSRNNRRKGDVKCERRNNHELRRPNSGGAIENDLQQKNDQVVTSVIPRKGYLRNRNQVLIEKATTPDDNNADSQKQENEQNGLEKCKLLGKLWLKNEVETLEATFKKKPMHVVLTPFIVVDAKALTEFTGIVKSLVKSKQFIVLIPNAVLGELDQLKKQSDRARNTIRWLEQEFKVGNRHMRAQRDHESQTLPLIKIPKKLDHESSVFIQIAKFCNFIVANHSDGSEFEANLVTFLSGDHLNERKSINLSFKGILDAIPVRHDQISNFYEKFNKK